MKRSSARVAALSSAPSAPGPNGAAHSDRPWWRYGIVWLVIGGPAAVVVAGIVTTLIAYHGADPVLEGAGRAQSRVVPARASQAADGRTEQARDLPPPTAAPGNRPTTPALQARNHAATPPAPSGPSR